MLRLQRFQQPLSRIALSTKGFPLQSLAALPKNYNASCTFTIQKASFSSHIPLIDRLLNNVPKGFEKYFRKNTEKGGTVGANKGKEAGNKGNPNGKNNKNNNMPPENDPVTLLRTVLALGALAFAAGLASEEGKSGR
jgi:hypothetical protein